MLNSWGKGRRRRFGWELCWFEGGVADAAHERRTPHSHSKKDSFEPWLESASFDSFVPVAIKPTLGKAGMAIPAAFWDTYCDVPPPRPTWAEHKAKLDRLRADDELTRGVPRRRKKKHLAQAQAAAAAAPPPRVRTGTRRSQRAPPAHEVGAVSSPTSDRTPRSARSVYGSEDSRHSSDREIQLLELGSAPSTIELAFASAQRALYDTAALLAASWRAGVASPPAGQSAVQPAAPGGRAAQRGRQRARRGRGGQGKKRGAS